MKRLSERAKKERSSMVHHLIMRMTKQRFIKMNQDLRNTVKESLFCRWAIENYDETDVI